MAWWLYFSLSLFILPDPAFPGCHLLCSESTWFWDTSWLYTPSLPGSRQLCTPCLAVICSEFLSCQRGRLRISGRPAGWIPVIPEATTGFQPTINSQAVCLALGSEIRHCRQGTLLNTKQEFQIHRLCGLLSYFISGLQPKRPRTYLCKTLEVFTSFPLNHRNPDDVSVPVSQMQGGLWAFY